MLFVQMQRDLNTFFGRHLGIVGRMETRRILCLVLSHNGITPTYMAEKSQPAQFKKNPGKLSVSCYPMNDFVERLATTNRHLPTPIINGTGYEGPVNIDINTDLQDIQRINRQLNSYGLELSTDYHDVDVLVITNTNQTF